MLGETYNFSSINNFRASNGFRKNDQFYFFYIFQIDSTPFYSVGIVCTKIFHEIEVVDLVKYF